MTENMIGRGQYSDVAPVLNPVKPLSSSANITDDQVNVVNKLLFQKLVTVFCAILDAAAMSNNWIIIDRTRPNESSATAELILEFAIRQTAQKPTIIVIDSVKRYSEYNSAASKSHLADLIELAKHSKPITSDGIEFDEPQIVPLPYSPDDFEDPTKFYDAALPCAPMKEHFRPDTK